MTLTLADIARAIDQGDFDHVPNAVREVTYAFLRRQAVLTTGRPPLPPKPRDIAGVPKLFDRAEEWLDYIEEHELDTEDVAKDAIGLHGSLHEARKIMDAGQKIPVLEDQLHEIAKRLLRTVFKVDPDEMGKDVKFG